MDTLKRVWVWLTHYMVVIHWDGVTKRHYAKTPSEVREWIDCYPEGEAVWGIRGQMIGKVQWGTADWFLGK